MAIALAIGAGAAAVGAAGNIFSSILGAKGASANASAIRDSAKIASETALTLNDRARADLQPFKQTGQQAGDLISQLMSGEKSLDDIFKQSGAFQYMSNLGTKNLNTQLSSRGLYNSGAGLQTLAQFNNQLVQQQGTQYMGFLKSVFDTGESAAAGQATAATQAGAQVSSIQAQAGQNIGAATQTQYQAYGSIGPAIGGAAQSGVGNYLNYQLYKPILDKLAGGGGGFASNYQTPDLESFANFANE
jgi:hypothetical protein